MNKEFRSFSHFVNIIDDWIVSCPFVMPNDQNQRNEMKIQYAMFLWD